MDDRCLVTRVIEGYQVCVIISGTPARSWVKTYETKGACLTELSAIDLATPDEMTAAMADDWDRRGAMLIYHSQTDPLVLQGAGFKEQFKAYIN